MRLIEPRKIDAAKEQKLIEEFRTAAFGEFCRTLSFITDFNGTDSAIKTVWQEAVQESNGTWSITFNECPDINDENAVVSSLVADKGLSFFDVIKTMAEFESEMVEEGYPSIEETPQTTLGDTYFRPFAIREAIAFDATTTMPVQTKQGNIIANGDFTVKMRRDIKQAWESKRSVFRLPQFDISRRLRTADEGLSAEELKKYLKTKEILPEYIRLFERYLDKYREAASSNFQYSHERREIDDVHTALEECIDEFPANSFPSKEDLRMNAAKMYVYYTIQQLQANYQHARENGNDSSEFIDQKALPELKKLENYFKDRAKSPLPSATRLTQSIMDENFTIEGYPPTDILENFTVLREWHTTMQTGTVLPEATLPETLPLGSHLPLEYKGKNLKADVNQVKIAEKIIDISRAYDRLTHAYQEWLSSGCTNNRLWELMAGDDSTEGLHDHFENLIQELPYNDIVSRDNLLEMSCRFWIAAEIWNLKAQHGEKNEKVVDRLETIVTYHQRQMKQTKGIRQDAKFRSSFPKEALETIADSLKKIPSTIEPDFKQWQEDLSDFSAAFKNEGLAVMKPRTARPTP